MQIVRIRYGRLHLAFLNPFAFVAGPRNEVPHGRDMSARPNPKVRQWHRPRNWKGQKHWWSISSHQRAGGASRKAGREIAPHFVW